MKWNWLTVILIVCLAVATILFIIAKRSDDNPDNDKLIQLCMNNTEPSEKANCYGFFTAEERTKCYDTDKPLEYCLGFRNGYKISS